LRIVPVTEWSCLSFSVDTQPVERGKALAGCFCGMGHQLKKIHAFKYLANNREKVLQIGCNIAPFLLIHK
jgi:hypothetical protein